MDLSPTPRRARSLALASVGDTLRLEFFLFDRIRNRLHHDGLHEGDRVRLAAAGGGHLVLETMDGHEVRVERDVARFVQVTCEGRRHRGRPGRSGALDRSLLA